MDDVPNPVHAHSWTNSVVRALAVLLVASALGLLINHFSPKPVPLFASDGPGALPQHAERISTEALAEELKQQKILILIDVREAESFNQAHPASALNAPAAEFIEHYNKLRLHAKLAAVDGAVIVCESEDCPSGDRVAKLLQELGAKSVRVLHGGWKAYERAGLATQSGESTNEL